MPWRSVGNLCSMLVCGCLLVGAVVLAFSLQFFMCNVGGACNVGGVVVLKNNLDILFSFFECRTFTQLYGRHPMTTHFTTITLFHTGFVGGGGGKAALLYEIAIGD